MSQNKNLALLQTNKLFEGVEESEIHVDLDQEGISFFKEGDIIYQSEDSSNTLYLIIEGDVKIKIPKEEEIELFEKTPRRSSAVANKDCLVYKLAEDKLKALIASDKKIEHNILELNPNLKIPVEEDIIEQPEEKEETKDEDIQVNEPKDITLSEHEEESLNEPESENVTDQKENLNTEPVENPDLDDIRIDDLSLPPLNLDELDQTLKEETVTEPLEEETETKESYEEPEPEDTKGNIQEEVKAEELKPEEKESDVEWGFGKSNGKTETEVKEDITESNVDWPKEPEIDKTEIETAAPEETIEFHTPKSDKDLLAAIQNIHKSIELNDTLNSISNSLKQLVHANVKIYLADEEKNELIPTSGGNTDTENIPFGKGLVGFSAENKELLNHTFPADDFRYDAEVDENVSTLLFPVINSDNELIAVIKFTHDNKGNFTKFDEEILSEISVHVSSAIENAKQYQSLLIRYKNGYLIKAANFIIGDVNTPLMLIKNYAEFIKRKSEVKEVKQISDFITEQTDLAINSNKAFHDFLTEENLIEPKVYKLNDVLDDILDQLAEYVEIRKVKLFKRFETNADVYLDKNNFYLACFQIAKNACDAMPDGGNIYLITKKENNSVQIEFKDTGKGINRDIKEKIFEPYFSFGKGPAAGLGLAVAKKIIKDHGGNIITGEVPGEGSEFIISLPVYEGKSAKGE